MSSSCLQHVPTDLGFGCSSVVLERRVDARVAGAGSGGEKEEGGPDIVVIVVNRELWRVKFFGREAEQRFGEEGVLMFGYMMYFSGGPYDLRGLSTISKQSQPTWTRPQSCLDYGVISTNV